MTKEEETKEKKRAEILETVNDLEKLLNERISELHEVDGMQQCRHAYIYYRTFLYKIRDIARKIV